MPSFKHGLTGYVRHRCRCVLCCTAMSECSRRNYNPAKQRERYQRNVDAYAERWQRYYAENKSKLRENYDNYYARNAQYIRDQAMARYRRESDSFEVTRRGKYSAAEDALILSDLPLRELAHMLGRSMGAISQRRMRLIDPEFQNAYKRRTRNLRLYGSENGQSSRWWTPEEDGIAARSDLSISEAAELLGRTHCSVKKRRLKLGIKIRDAYQRVDNHCANGHELTADNIYSHRRGDFCRTCTNTANVRYRERRKANKIQEAP